MAPGRRIGVVVAAFTFSGVRPLAAVSVFHPPAKYDERRMEYAAAVWQSRANPKPKKCVQSFIQPNQKPVNQYEIDHETD
jgi:hypothetical protein